MRVSVWGSLVREAQRDILERTLAVHRGNVTETAKTLGIQRSYVHRLIKELAVKRPT